MNLLFDALPIRDETKQAIEALGLVETTAIQHEAIPVMLAGKDLIGQAQTGTGKTFAFAIPILEKIDPACEDVQALVICPTRELTLQVYKEFLKLVKFNRAIRVTSVYGGESYTKQFKALAAHPQIVVATPGRAIDHLERKTIDFSQLRVLVLDEADEMLKMGFQEDLERMLRDTPSSRQTALFSATIPPFIKKVAERYQRQPVIIKIDTPTMTVSLTEQYYVMVRKADRDQLLLRLLDYYAPPSAIIFANTKKDVDDLSAFLQKHNREAEALHGDLKQSQRDQVMNRFRSKKMNYLIATDVAARGLDIKDVDMVINYEMPFEDEVYVHRIGRTGRAGKSGVSISLVYPSLRTKLNMIERFIKTRMVELSIPDETAINARMRDRAYESIKRMIENQTADVSDIITKLRQDGFSDEAVMTGLLNATIKVSTDYEPIGPPIRKPALKTERSDTSNRRKPATHYRLATINLGKSDGFRPVTLLDYFKKHADLYPRNIGDIEMEKSMTRFQIHPAAVKRLESLQSRLVNGRQIKIQILKTKS
ncbi:MAG: DEAD/DEAH box helicase [Acholeplasmataceae bacterium]|nr:MAG: DEAD/DEAH box helicase [Acholeplasmataceae bacterium]